LAKPTMEELRGDLQEIRYAAGNLRSRQWSAAVELNRVMKIRAKRVAAIYELALVDRHLKSSFSVTCMEWEVTYRQATASPSRSEFQDATFPIAEKLATRIDALLVSLQAHEDEGMRS
jgi:hypothetical protein